MAVSLPTVQASRPGGTTKASTATSSPSEPSRPTIFSRPWTMYPTCRTSQRSVFAIGLMCSDHRQPGSEARRKLLTSPSSTTSALPLPKTRVSSGASSRFLSTAAFWVVDASAMATSFESNRRLLGTSLDLGQTWLLVDPHQVSCGVTKRGHDLTGVLVNGFNDLAAGRDDGVNCKGRAGDHDVDHQAGSGCDRPPEDPGAADLADGVVERRRDVPSFEHASRRRAGRTRPTARCRLPESRCSRSCPSGKWAGLLVWPYVSNRAYTPMSLRTKRKAPRLSATALTARSPKTGNTGNPWSSGVP